MSDNQRELDASPEPKPPQFQDRFKTKPLFFEPNPVRKIIEAGVEHPVTYEVGENGVTLIEIYGEHGQMAMVPFVAVYKGEKCVCRINAASVIIFFKEA